MVWPHPRDVILYARSSYFYNNMFIIYLFLTLFWFYMLFWSLTQKTAGTFAITLGHVIFTSYNNYDVTSSCFPSLVPCLKLHYVTSPQEQVTDVSLVLKDSDMDSENLSSLILLSVSDGQKTDSSKLVSFIGI